MKNTVNFPLILVFSVDGSYGLRAFSSLTDLSVLKVRKQKGKNCSHFVRDNCLIKMMYLTKRIELTQLINLKGGSNPFAFHQTGGVVMYRFSVINPRLSSVNLRK